MQVAIEFKKLIKFDFFVNNSKKYLVLLISLSLYCALI